MPCIPNLDSIALMSKPVAELMKWHLSLNGKVWVLYIILGAGLMVLAMHPAIEGIHLWRSGELSSSNPWHDIILQPIKATFQPVMVSMTAWLAVAGAFVGGLFALLHTGFQGRLLQLGDSWSEQDLFSLIEEGEGEAIEFKSSLRYDWIQKKVNKALEITVAKSIAGLANHHGGYLFIGIDDGGNPVGIERDLGTLSRPNWDGFSRCLVSVVTSYLGKYRCTHLHVYQFQMDGKTVAVVRVDASSEPVYCRIGNNEHYFVRTGNATQDLDVREAMAHISERHSNA